MFPILYKWPRWCEDFSALLGEILKIRYQKCIENYDVILFEWDGEYLHEITIKCAIKLSQLKISGHITHYVCNQAVSIWKYIYFEFSIQFNKRFIR